MRVFVSYTAEDLHSVERSVALKVLPAGVAADNKAFEVSTAINGSGSPAFRHSEANSSSVTFS